MKKITKITAIATLAITLFTSTASAVKMYSPDGRTASVMEQDVAAWKAKGWSTKNYKTMYVADGRSEKVLLTDVAAWRKVGWYEVPVTVMYSSINGSTMIVANSEIEAYRKVGWQQFHEHFIGKTYRYIENYCGSMEYGGGDHGGVDFSCKNVRASFIFDNSDVDLVRWDNYGRMKINYNILPYQRCWGVLVLVTRAEPGLISIANSNGYVSRKDFERYVGVITSGEPLEDGCFYYEKNGYSYLVYCEEDGSINIHKTYADICK